MLEIENGVLLAWIPDGEERTVRVPEGVHTVGNGAFLWNDALERVFLPDSVRTVEEEAFYGCSALKEIRLPEGLVRIGADAFHGCKSLKELILPQSLRSVGNGAFAWSALQHVAAGGQTREIGEKAFYKCTGLLRAVFAAQRLCLGVECFGGCCRLEAAEMEGAQELGAGIFSGCEKLRFFSFPKDCRTVPDRCFFGCASLENAGLHDGIERFGAHAFHGCGALKALRCPENLKVIDDGCFQRCESLREAALAHAGTIGSGAFLRCGQLRSLRFSSPPESVGELAFFDSPQTPPDGVKKMCCTSFLFREDPRPVPILPIPASVRELTGGWDAVLTYDEIHEGCSCRTHLLILEKYNMRLLIGKRYYSDKTRGGGEILRDGELDFARYDRQFSLAAHTEKPVIAALRLAYGKRPEQPYKARYEKAVTGREEEIGFFAVDTDDSVLLAYCLSLPGTDRLLRERLYDRAIRQKKPETARQITAPGAKRADFAFSFSFDGQEESLREWQTRRNADRLILERYDGEKTMVRLPVEEGVTVTAGDGLFDRKKMLSVAVPKEMGYPGGGLAGCLVNLEYCHAQVYIPGERPFAYGSCLYGGVKYFDFERYDRELLAYRGQEKLRCVLLRLLSPVDMPIAVYESYAQMAESAAGRQQELSDTEWNLLEKLMSRQEHQITYTDAYRFQKCPNRTGEILCGGVRLLTEDGGTRLLGYRQEEPAETLVLPAFLRVIGSGALAGLQAKRLELPMGLEKIEKNSFQDASLGQVLLHQNTAVPVRLLEQCRRIEEMILVNENGEKETIPFPADSAPEIRERASFLFSLRCAEGFFRFPFGEYDRLPMSRGDSIRRTAARIVSAVPPEGGMCLIGKKQAFFQMMERQDWASLRRGVENGFWAKEYENILPEGFSGLPDEFAGLPEK